MNGFETSQNSKGCKLKVMSFLGAKTSHMKFHSTQSLLDKQPHVILRLGKDDLDFMTWEYCGKYDQSGQEI